MADDGIFNPGANSVSGREGIGAVGRAGAPSPRLDSYSNLYAVHAPFLAISSYSGPLFTIRRESDNATLDVYPSAGGWPNYYAIVSWLGGGVGFVTMVYDQTGNGRTLTQTTTTSQPILNLDGAHPVFEATGTLQGFAGTTGLAAFSNGVAAVSLVAVCQRDVASSLDSSIMFASAGTNAATTRLTFGPVAATSTNAASGRRLDANAIQRTAGFALDTNWAVEIARWDCANATLYHQRDAASEVKTAFQTAGNFDTTSSLSVTVFNANGGAYWNGKASLFAWVQAKLSDADVASMVSKLAPAKMPSSALNQFVNWSSTNLTGTYALAPGLTNYTVITPDGTTPTQAALTSHRYHHHTRCAYKNGRVWFMFSSGGTNEDAGGQMTVAVSTPDGGITMGAPVLLVPSQSTFNATGASDVDGTRVTYPRTFITYAGNLYAIIAVDLRQNGNQTGAALVGVLCADDGTVGSPFLISTDTYTAFSGFATIPYDPVLGPALFNQANIFGTWGGSYPGNPASTFTGWFLQGGMYFTEPATFPLDTGGLRLQRLWRKVGGSLTNWLWSSLSNDGGTTWTDIRLTNIPNPGSPAACLLLPDGRIALTGNPQDAATSRDPLYLALFNGSTGLIGSNYAVRQGISPTPTYPGTAKSGGAAYPGMCLDGSGNLWTVYSMQKETIGATKIPLSGI